MTLGPLDDSACSPRLQILSRTPSAKLLWPRKKLVKSSGPSVEAGEAGEVRRGTAEARRQSLQHPAARLTASHLTRAEEMWREEDIQGSSWGSFFFFFFK